MTAKARLEIGMFPSQHEHEDPTLEAFKQLVVAGGGECSIPHDVQAIKFGKNLWYRSFIQLDSLQLRSDQPYPLGTSPLLRSASSHGCPQGSTAPRQICGK